MMIDQHLPLIIQMIMLQREYACIKNISGEELVLLASGDTPAGWTLNQIKMTFFSEGSVWCRWEFAGVVVFPCWRGCLTHAEVLSSISRLVNWMDGLAAHSPWFTKLLRTDPNEQTGSWYSPGTEGWYRWWEWCQYSEGKRRSEDPANALVFSS